jgi:hypothetical protein
MQNTKDTFYELLRTRLAALNPDRTVVVRGATRPGIVVEQNELASPLDIPDCFRLRWGAASVDTNGALPLVALQCEIAYETAGTALNSGMDRGRALAAMDGELLAALTQSPQTALKTSYAALAFNNAATPMTTSLWWSKPNFSAVEIKTDRIARTAAVDVMSFQEAGEL